VHELLRWLDVIPGRRWLLLGPAAAELAAAIQDTCQPAGVTAADDTLPLDASTFDVAILTDGSLTQAVAVELHRVIWPSGIAAAWVRGERAELEAIFRSAGLHAVQTCEIGTLTAVRGAR